MKNMEIGQHELVNRLPDATITINLTPTKASISTKDSLYVQAMTSLDINIPVPSDSIYECSSLDNNFEFVWNWRGVIEKDSYEPFNTELKKRYPSYIVDSGQHLLNGNLFKEDFWALRKMEHEKVLFLGTVHGRTDLVVLHDALISDKHYITRNMVTFGIEIKMHSEMETPSGLARCIRETVTQLLGLNVGNINNSPSMILTDLTQLHFCVYLVLERQMPLKFSIKVQKCLNLASVLHLAGLKGGQLLENGRPICFNFARKPTPPPSEANNIDANEEASDNLEGIE
jgi:hypothetical protein